VSVYFLVHRLSIDLESLTVNNRLDRWQHYTTPYVRRYVTVRYFCQILNQIGACLQILIQLGTNLTKFLPMDVALFHVERGRNGQA